MEIVFSINPAISLLNFSIYDIFYHQPPTLPQENYKGESKAVNALPRTSKINLECQP